MGFLDRVRACQVRDLGRYRPFRVAGDRVGWVGHRFADRLAAYPSVFVVGQGGVDLAAGFADEPARTAAVDAVLRDLARQGEFPGWRDERYPVAARLGASPLLLLERAAVPLFGVRACGLHLNGFVRDGDGILMWIGRRADDRIMEPGKLDQIVAGGQPAGLSLAENLRKEAAEEAAIPPELADRAAPVGVITYLTERAEGLRNDVVYVYDLELPRAFEPHNQDGEIAGFSLVPLDEVAEIVRTSNAFKFNCSLVVIDFLIRHGRFDPADPDYVAIVEGLRSGQIGVA